MLSCITASTATHEAKHKRALKNFVVCIHKCWEKYTNKCIQYSFLLYVHLKGSLLWLIHKFSKGKKKITVIKKENAYGCIVVTTSTKDIIHKQDNIPIVQ